MSGGWIGVDLDATLAEYHGWNDGTIGAPIPEMTSRVRVWLADGKDVRILTARVAAMGRDPQEVAAARTAIEDWCFEHLGRRLPVTSEKDFGMFELWDDRAVRVIPNTGRPCCGGHT
jgi:hypothetical protein